MPAPLRTAGLFVGALVLLLAGCGSESDSDEPAEPVDTSTPVETAEARDRSHPQQRQ